ncbi:hypothetical protein ACLOJK_012554 [Asimina triloba]
MAKLTEHSFDGYVTCLLQNFPEAVGKLKLVQHLQRVYARARNEMVDRLVQVAGKVGISIREVCRFPHSNKLAHVES